MALAMLLFATGRGGVWGRAGPGMGVSMEPIRLHTPNGECAGCHRDIYERYSRTPMAQASGVATQGLISGGFTHAASGVRYEVSLREGRAYLRYERNDRAGPRQLAGEQALELYVGSGHRGRTYLFENGGLWFEAPVNYYGKKQVWDMAPAYKEAKEMPFTLPVDGNCLHCHAGELQPALAGGRNRYAGLPFEAGGVLCSGCHGDATAHMAGRGRGAIVNPAKLTAAKRDSVCLQCHLEGKVTVYRAGRSLAEFTAGNDLAAYAVYFVDAAAADAQEQRATSQWEALLRSACKRGSGEKLTCTSCHDPHGSPEGTERVEFYRAKCLNCHTGAAMATKHHSEERNCSSCHMPVRKSGDIPHEQITDHQIVRRTNGRTARVASSLLPELTPVGGVAAGDREYGLAYAQKAQGGNRAAGEKALGLLERAEKAGANDVEVHVKLGFLRQLSGDRVAARKEYSAALGLDPRQTTALSNLAVLDAAEGQEREAVGLLKRVLEEDPTEAAPAHDLALLECLAGNLEDARKALNLLQRFSPDDRVAREMLERWGSGKGSCRF
jgi:predicted CXXCH cytochrome family protein